MNMAGLCRYNSGCSRRFCTTQALSRKINVTVTAVRISSSHNMMVRFIWFTVRRYYNEKGWPETIAVKLSLQSPLFWGAACGWSP